jgi:hypothetical protein
MRTARREKIWQLDQLEARQLLSNLISELEPNSRRAFGTALDVDGRDGRSTVVGQITAGGDRDFFRLPAAKSGSMTLDFRADESLQGRVVVKDSQGQRLFAGDTRQGGLIATIDVQAGDDLFIRVKGTQGTIGDYQFDLKHDSYAETCSFTTETDDILARVQQYMQSLGIDSISELGTIEVRADGDASSFSISPGVHVLQRDTTFGLTALEPASSDCWTAVDTDLGGVFETDDGATLSIPDNLSVGPVVTGGSTRLELARPTGAAARSASAATATGTATTVSGPATLGSLATGGLSIGSIATANQGSVVRYEGSQVTDTAVILASKVIFDGASLVLSDSVTEFIIVAETIESRDGSVISWIHSGTEADAMAAYATSADDGTDYDPDTEVTGISAFHSPDGGDGDPGADGATGNAGLDAPDVYVYIKDFTVIENPDTEGVYNPYIASFPAFDVTG